MMKKFYGVVYGDWHGIDWDGLEEVFEDKDRAEEYCDELNDYEDSDEFYVVWEMMEEEVEKYWNK